MARRFPWLMAFVVLSFGLGAGALAAEAEKEEVEAEWKETMRDVWIDGRIDRGALVLRAAEPPRLALLATSTSTDAVVLDLDALTVERLDVTVPVLGERGLEADAGGKPHRLKNGSVSKIDTSTYLLTLADRSVIIATHNGTPGPIERATVFATVPSWEALFERYEPDADAVATLESYEGDIQLTLAFGTWCGDSKRAVPRLLKTLDAAGNDNIELQLVSVHGSFEQPGELIQGERLTNVPTLIVSRDGREIGRVVETSTSDSMASDLAQMLAGEPLLHPGRWDREERLAAGRYSHRDAAGHENGIEDWELFALEDGGTLLHAWSDFDGRLTDVWHRRDATGHSTFVEITRTDGEWHSRTRHNVRDSVLSATTRGNGTGLVRQTVRLDAETVLVSPAAADAGRTWALSGRPTNPAALPALVLGGSGESPAARPAHVTLTYRGRETIATPAGKIMADKIAYRLDWERSEWWLDPDFGVPLRGRNVAGDEVVLTRFERGPAQSVAAN